jgi:hypothetical protein
MALALHYYIKKHMTGIILAVIMLLALTVKSQDTTGNRMKHPVKHVSAKDVNNTHKQIHKGIKNPADTMRANNDTGAGTGIMPESKSNGKVTNNPKGKAGPKNTKTKAPLKKG